MVPPFSDDSRPIVRRLLRLALVVAVGLSLLVVDPSTLRAGTASELEVKAAFLLNFLKFVEWPADRLPNPTAPYIIAVMGEDALGATLVGATIGKTIGTRPVQVQVAARTSDISSAHLVFIAASHQRQLPTILRELEGRGVLTVGDTPGFAESGVVLNLVTQDNRVRFEANTAAAARARLRLSSHLLRIARIVG
jgi:YfiR/HmsC-like